MLVNIEVETRKVVTDRRGQQVEIAVNLREDSILYSARSKNVKTDDMPQQSIGATKEESHASCAMCPLYQDRTCYSQFGTPAIGFASTRRARDRGKDKSLDAALEGRSKKAKYVRFGAIGDAGSIAPDVFADHVAKVRTSGLGLLNYTHQWYLDHAQHMKADALASCDDWRDVVDAVAIGWRTTLHVDANASVFNGQSISEKPQGKVDGISYTLCPAQREGSTTTCNDCGLCDASKGTRLNVVVFSEHGVAMSRSKA